MRLEVTGGLHEGGEAAEAGVCRRDGGEAGGESHDRVPVADYLVSPGGTSESVGIVCGRVDASRVGGIHGKAEEHEDINVVAVPFAEARKRLRDVGGCNPGTTDEDLRRALLRFIADFANWDNAAQPTYLEVGRALVKAAHAPGDGGAYEPPLVVDPFAGGGSIPLEALRLGGAAFAAMSAAASSGTTPSCDQAAVAASSTSSQVASLPSSDQILAIAGRE